MNIYRFGNSFAGMFLALLFTACGPDHLMQGHQDGQDEIGTVINDERDITAKALDVQNPKQLMQRRQRIALIANISPGKLITPILYSTDYNPLNPSETAEDVQALKDAGYEITRVEPLVRTSLSGRKSTPIFYHAYIPKDPTKIKGVVVTAYGAGLRNEITSPKTNTWSQFAVTHGYAVFELNVRGTPDYQVFDKGKFRPHYQKGSTEFELASRNADGINSIIRDVAYVAASIKEGSIMPQLQLTGRPIVFVGESFGGLVATRLATENDVEVIRTMKGQVQKINEVFDGIIAHAPYTDVKLDLESLTSAGISRQSGRDPKKRKYSGNWMANAFGVTGDLLDDATNRKVSSLEKTQNLKRPILLSHGLKDDNVTPRASLQFYVNAVKNNKGNLVSFLLDRDSDHYWNGVNDQGELQSPNARPQFIKTMLYFLDNVALGGRNFYSPNDTKLKDTAWFVFRAVHPVVGRPYMNLAYNFVKYRHENPMPSVQPSDYFTRNFLTYFGNNHAASSRALGNLFSIYLHKTSDSFKEPFLSAVSRSEAHDGNPISNRRALEAKLAELPEDSIYIDWLDVKTKAEFVKNTDKIQEIFVNSNIDISSLSNFMKSVPVLCRKLNTLLIVQNFKKKHGPQICQNYILYGPAGKATKIEKIADAHLMHRLLKEVIFRQGLNYSNLFGESFISDTLKF